MSDKSKTQLAIDHIFAHPGCRSDTLSGILNCQRKDVPAYLKDVLASGLIVSCKVEVRVEGERQNMHEYRPSASAPAIAPDFKEWRKTHFTPPPEKPLTPLSGNGIRVKSKSTSSVVKPQPAVGTNNTGSRELVTPVGESGPPAKVATVDETQGGRVMAAPEATASASPLADSDVKSNQSDIEIIASQMFQLDDEHAPIDFIDPQLFATLSIEGAVHIEFAGKEVLLPAFAVRQLHDFLEDTHPVFN